MKIRKYIFIAVASISLLSCCATHESSTSQFEAMADSLISKMTIDERIHQLHFDAPAIPRLGIDKYNYWSEAVHGVARFHEATVFPHVIGLGSTWDPEKVAQMSKIIGTEARVFHNKYKFPLTFFSPTINLVRDPRWGRTEETYSEDPYLTGRMGVAFVQGLQQNDSTYRLAAATAKHFAADNSEFHRTCASSYADMRDLREYYFPAFKTTVQEGEVASIMTTYRGINGLPTAINQWLCNQVLRKEWGFKGYIVTDCWAISDVVNNHRYVKTPEEAAALAVAAGTDLNCGTTYNNSLKSAFEKGLVSEEQINTLLRRVLVSRFMLGDLDPKADVPYDHYADTLVNCKAHQKLALELARESAVLLKNQNGALPFDKGTLKSLAVIGALANTPEYGPYSGHPNQTITMLQGIQNKVNAAVNAFIPVYAERFTEGSYFNRKLSYATFENGKKSSKKVNHLSVKNNDWMMFHNIDFADGAKAIKFQTASQNAGGTIEVRLDSKDNAPIATVKIENSKAWDKLIATQATFAKVDGIHDLYLTFKGNKRVLFDILDFTLVPVNRNYKPTKTPIDVKFAKGCAVSGNDESGFEEALKIARECEKVVYVIGTDMTLANEGLDVASLKVPEIQEKLLKAVYEVNPNVTLVLASGYPLTINWEKANIPSILSIWHTGQAQGYALADILFGDYNPGGRLSGTWYIDDTKLPKIDDYRIRETDRTYLYYKDDVIYPFGHGLSYTTFTYNNLKLSSKKCSSKDDIRVSVDVTNSGKLVGDEVVQLYFRDVEASVKVPVKKLIRFKRIHLNPNETQTVTFDIPASELGYWSIKKNDFIVETGDFDFMVGSSSSDIRATQTLSVKGEKYEQGVIRVNTGGDYLVDEKGNTWMPDYGYRYGTHLMAKANTMADQAQIFKSMRIKADINAAHPVNGYPNADTLYEWWKNLATTTPLYYNYEVVNGTYDVKLYFSELAEVKPGERVFSINIEKKPVIENLDIAKEVGTNKGLVKTINGVQVTDNYINIDFIDKVGLPCISAIEITPVE